MERREASRANQRARAAMTGPGTREAMADQGSPWLGPWPGHYGHGHMPRLGGAREERGLVGTREEQALEGARKERALKTLALEERALERTCKESSLEGADEERALELGSNSYPQGSIVFPYSIWIFIK